MGHRSNTIIIQNGDAFVRSSHWGALSIPDCLTVGPVAFLSPPDEEPADEPRLCLYDSAWCEGFVCVDHDRKQVLYDSGQSEAYQEPDVRYFLMQKVLASWPGWNLYFVGPGCGSGIDTIARYLEHTVEKRLPEVPLAVLEIPRPAEIQRLPAQRAELDTEVFVSWNTILRCIGPEPSDRVYQFSGGPLGLLALGTRLFEALTWFQPQVIHDHEKSWNQFEWPSYRGLRAGYVEVNSGTRRIRFWEAIPTYATLEAVRRAWEWDGFQVVRLSTEDLICEPALRNLAIANESSAQWAEVQRKAEQMLGKDVVSEMIGSFQQSLDNLRRQGHTIEYVNPKALEP